MGEGVGEKGMQKKEKKITWEGRGETEKWGKKERKEDAKDKAIESSNQTLEA